MTGERLVLLVLNQTVDASVSSFGWCSGGSSIELGGIFLVFLIHSAALCSASSNCSMVMVLLTWFLARAICSIEDQVRIRHSMITRALLGTPIRARLLR